MTVINIPNILNERLTEEGAQAFVDIIEKIEESTQSVTMQMAAERFERRLAEVGGELRTEMAGLKSSLNSKVESSQTTIIKWVVSVAIGQMAIILGIIALFFK